MKKIVICLMLILLVGCSKKEENNIIIVEEEVFIEYGNEEFDPMQLVVWGTFDNVVIKEFDYYTLGLQEMILIFNVGEEEIEFKKEVEVVDTIFPIFTDFEENITIKQDEELNIMDYVVAFDEIDKNDIEIYLNVEIDTSVAGNYSREVVAKDKNGNVTSELVMIVVEEKIRENNNNTSSVSSSNNNSTTNNQTSNVSNETNSNSSIGENTQEVVPSIQGVRNVSLPIGSSVIELQALISNVYLNVSGQVYVNYAEVNLGVAGDYKVYYTSSVGVSATCTVTIY
ncbi:MAG: hypothetical protein ACK5LZ_06190 [Anaerorhabdus sp.]